MKTSKKIFLILLISLLNIQLTAQNSKLLIKVGKECKKEVRIFSRAENIEQLLSSGTNVEFEFTVDNNEPKQLFVAGCILNMKMAPNDQVTLSVSGENGESISLSGGKFEALNKYQLFKSKFMKGSWSKTQSLTDSSVFKTQMDQLIKSSVQLLEELVENGDVEKQWAEEEKLRNKYYVLNRQVSYPFMNAAYSYKKKPDAIPSFTKAVVSKEVLNNPEVAIYGQNLIQSILYNYGKLFNDKYPGTPNPSAIGNLKMMQKLVTNKEVKSLVSQILLARQLGEYSDANIKPIMDYFIENCLDEKVKKEMLAKVEEVSLLGPGKPAPEIELIDMEGKIHYLSDYKGNNVYIDVWATYCGKCIAEMPHLNKIEEDYKGKNWVFLMVSLDTDKTKWLKKAKELGNLEHQFIVDKGHKSQFNKDYRIGYAPRYIIIDKKGKLVNFNAPFPSDPKTRRIMNSLQ